MEIELTDQNGDTLRLEDELRGGPVALVFFRGHWWIHCNGQLVSLAHRYGELREAGASVVAVSVDNRGLAAGLTQKLRLPFPVCADPDGSSAIKPFGAWSEEEERAAPVTVLLAADGSEAWRHDGSEPSDRPFEDDLLAALQSLGAPARPSAGEVHAHVGPESSDREVGLRHAHSFFKGSASAAGAVHRKTGDAYAGRVAERATGYADALGEVLDAPA